jgi:simple sugar transport system permease protein
MNYLQSKHNKSPFSWRKFTLGFIFLLISIFIFIHFGVGSPVGGISSFDFNSDGVSLKLPIVQLPTRWNVFLLSAISAFMSGRYLMRGTGQRTTTLLIICVCFILSILFWATQTNPLNVIGLIKSTILRAVPITLGALSGVLCERSGVINIAIEGQMLFSAFISTVFGSIAGSPMIGLFAGLLSGGLLGLLLAFLAIKCRIDQIISGFVINIFSTGITAYLAATMLRTRGDLNMPGLFHIINIKPLSQIPVIGPIIFTGNFFVYLTLVLIIAVHLSLFYTKWGLRSRAVGEHPKAADTLGINPLKLRYTNVIIGGMISGLAGAYFSLGSVGRFDQGMTAGRGFISIVALIFGGWNPLTSFAAALVFGFSESLQTVLGVLNTGIPSEILMMLPYLVTIIVVAGFVGRTRPPAADGQPYIR